MCTNGYRILIAVLFLPFTEVKFADDFFDGLRYASKALSYVDGSNAGILIGGGASIGSLYGQASSFTGIVGAVRLNIDMAIRFYDSFETYENNRIERNRKYDQILMMKEDDREWHRYMADFDYDLSTMKEQTLQFMNEIASGFEHNSNYQTRIFADALTEFKEETLRTFAELKILLSDLKDSISRKMIDNTDEIDRAAEVLDSSVKHQFRALSELNVHLKFTEAIMLDTDALENLMIQTIKYPGNDTRHRFIELYKNKRPRRIVLELANRFKYKFTNPIIASMELHIFKSRHIFNSWKETISQILYRLVTIDGFYFGLKGASENSTLTFKDPCFDAVQELIHEFQTFADNFKIDTEMYWPDIIGFEVDQIIEKRKIGEEDSIADAIQNLLNGIYTKDVFYIHVAGGAVKDGTGFKRKLNNPERFKPIEIYDGNLKFSAMSPQNVDKEKPIGGGITQITAYNNLMNMAVSVIRSETHSRKTKDDIFELNNMFMNTVEEKMNIQSQSDDFRGFFMELNKKMRGELGGAVMSNKPISERITNGVRSTLHWYNQVPYNSQFINVMWI